MNGKEVYKFATREVPKVILEALDAANMKVEEVDWLLLHQVSNVPLLVVIFLICVHVFHQRFLTTNIRQTFESWRQLPPD
jgi:hypothetical protein